MPGSEGNSGVVFAADSLNVEGLPGELRQFRSQVNQILSKADRLIEKLRKIQTAQAMALDLMQTRDNILREIVKMDGAPGDAKWTAQEMRESVQAMLKLLKEQYDKAAGTSG
ncbi:MAG TPA: hypothetical protein VGA56_25855 [Opitutaceae bacterium]